MEKPIKDTGVSRTHFETGATKDIAEGRGRYDLLPLRTLERLYSKSLLSDTSEFLNHIRNATQLGNLEDKKKRLIDAYEVMLRILKITKAESVQRLAKIYEKGATKYAERDWEKGRPMEVYINSILRHYFQWQNNEVDEDHSTAVLWNIISLIDTIDRLPYLAYTHEVILDHTKSE